MKRLVILLPAAAAAVGLAFAVGRLPEAAFPQRGGQDFLSTVFGDARSVIGSALYHKADSYFHGGVDMDGGHECVFHGPGEHEHEHDHDHCDHDHGRCEHEHHDAASPTEGTAAPAQPAFDPWRWINSRVQAPQVERHLEGKKIGELVPILWASVKTDPKNVEAWTTAWYVASVMMNDKELGNRIMAEGLKANPDSAEMHFFHARAILDGGKGDRSQALVAMRKVQEMLLKRCSNDESRLSESDAETLHHARLFIKAIDTFTNPVIGPDWPDPTVWNGGDGWYYSVATQLGTVYRSRNLIDWEDTKTSPISEATRAQLTQVTHNLWAPSVVKIGDTWNLYISRFVSDAKCTIVALTSKTPQGPFVYREVVIDSEREGILNAIDPYVLEADGRVLMFFGSLADGVHAVELTKDGLAIAPGAKPVHVAGIRRPQSKRVGAYEGSYVMKRGKWWYLFVSGGHYGDHTYYLTVGRATDVMGPYLDRAGQPLTAGKAPATLASRAGDRFFGPGHNGDVFTSADGRTWMFYHSHDANLPRKSCRPCLLQELKWTPDGWPCFENDRPKITESRFAL